MANLFPAYAVSSVKRKFDPTDECVAAEQQRKKKSDSKGKSPGRGKSVLAVVIEGKPSSIPKRTKKETLMQEGKAKKIEFCRYFSLEDVNSLLAETFSNLGKLQFVFLQPHRNNQLTIAKEQKSDGNAIFNLAKNGVLYLQVLSDNFTSFWHIFKPQGILEWKIS